MDRCAQARYYGPIAGRFLSADPIGYADQMNLYAYVHNDPVGFVDPFGLYTCLGDNEQCAAYEQRVQLLEAAVQSDDLSAQEKSDLQETIDFIRNDDRYFVAFESLDLMRSENLLGGAYTDEEAGAIVSVFADNFFEFYEGYEASNPNFSAVNAQAGVVGHEGEHGKQFAQGLTKEIYNSDRLRYERPADRVEQSITKGLGTQPKCSLGHNTCNR